MTAPAEPASAPAGEGGTLSEVARPDTAAPEAAPTAKPWVSNWFLFVRSTSFRLAGMQALILAGFAAAVLGYLYSVTAGDLTAKVRRDLSEEHRYLASVHAAGGYEQLNIELIHRTSARSKFFYGLFDPQGRALTGDFGVLPVEPVGTAIDFVRFRYLPPGAQSGEARHAAGLVQRFEDASVLLVAADVDDLIRVVERLTRSIWILGLAAGLFTLGGAYLFSRQASRRVEQFSSTADAVIHGRLSERLAVSGSGDEYDRLAVRMNRMLDRIQSLVMAQRYSGDALAHDLRSPLSRLRNRLYELEIEAADEAARESLGLARADAEHVLDTFRAILRLSKLEAGAGGTLELADLSALAEDLAELFEPACEQAEQVFAAEVQPGLKGYADRELLAQALSNLLDNAIKYTPAGGAVSLRARRLKSGEIELAVSDSGPGIPPEQRARVRERFVRLEGSRTRPGHGLGLALVAAVGDLHGGRLEFDSAGGPPEAPGLRAAIILPPASDRGQKPAA